MNDDNIVVDAIRNSCTLVVFGTHKWQPLKTDSNLAAEVKTDKNAKGKAVQAKVNLANGFEHLLSKVTRVMSRAYHSHIRMTVPWGEGQRLLPNLQLVEYMTEMQGHRTELDTAKATLLTALPAAIQQAVGNNGDMGDIADYPTPQVIADTFDYEWDFAPVSDVAGFAGLPEGFRDRFEQNYQGKVGKLLDEGVDDVKKRLLDLLTKWKKVLESDKPKFFQSTIDNISQLGTTLGNLNIAADVDQQTLADAVLDLGRYTSDQLRENEQAKQATAASVVAILSILQPACANIDAPPPAPADELLGVTTAGTTPLGELLSDETEEAAELLGELLPELGMTTPEPVSTVETTPDPEPEPEEPKQDNNDIESLLNQLF